MNQLAKAASTSLTPAQLALAKRTVAKDLDKDEFDLFMAVAARANLDPFRRQITALVFNKDKPDRRQMSIITTIDGLRTIAARSGEYRPSEDVPEVICRQDLKSDLNPLGVERAIVRVFKRFGADWHSFPGVARWDEFAPVKELWAKGADGKWAPTGKFELTGKWPQMPELMICKCAEAQALRRGWPEDMSGLYAEEEMQRAIVIDTASQAVETYERDQRLERINRLGRETLTFLFDPDQPLEVITHGQTHDRIMEHYEACTAAQDIIDFRLRNKESLTAFWALDKAAALACKKRAEERIRELNKQETDDNAE